MTGLIRKHFQEIEDLLSQGFTVAGLANSLTLAGFEISRQTLSYHLKRERKRRAGADGKENLLDFPAPSSPTPACAAVSFVPVPIAQAADDVAATPAPVANCAPLVLEKPKTMDEYRANQEKIKVKARQIIASQKDVPPEINQLKFITIKGKGVLDVTQMNISDFLTVSKTIPENTPVPDDLLMTVAAENRIKNLYERALTQYSEAVVAWKLNQLKGKS